MFRPILRLFVAAALAVVVALPARAALISAADLLDAKTDYVADFYLTSGVKGSYQGSVLHAPGRERREFDTSSGRQALLLRRDIDEATMMWPERKWYLSTSFNAVADMVGGFDSMMLDRKRSGAETVSGESCVRYDVTGSSDQGGEFQGRMWFTKDDILMKAAGTVRFQGRDTKIETGLLNLRRVKSDASAFALPADYKGLPFDLSKFGLTKGR